jgi:hypothetical protein
LAVALSTLLAVIAAALCVPVMARADGDPASDVLATQPLFLPQDAQFSHAGQQELAAELASATHAGVPLRVAVVASTSDLGSVTALWRRPAVYARFLDQELAFLYRGPLVVVMPNGIGVAAQGHVPPALAALAAPQRYGHGSPGLQHSTLTAVGDWLKAHGQGVSVHVASRAPTTGLDLTAIVVLALGALLIVLAWALSLRARPPGSRLSSSVNP